MLRFDDLMAARVLDRQVPDKRLPIFTALQKMRGRSAPTSLLALLVQLEVLSMDQARWVHAQVERYKRTRGVGIFAHLLAREGVPMDRLKRLVEHLGPDADLNTLGDTVVSQGMFPAEREQQVRFQARLAIDRDQANQVQAWENANPLSGESGETQIEMIAPQMPPPGTDVNASSVLRLGEVGAALAGAAQEEAGRIVRGTLSDADAELPGPQFRIPEWVDMSDPRTGKQIKGYRILGRIGAGAMGTVYLVDRQDDATRPIALKLLAKEASDEARGRFKREILANSFFSHAGAIEIMDAGKTEQGHEYMAMEFFDGKDLSVVLDAEKRLAPRRAASLARQVFDALSACHGAGVIHRDIKPANILVSRDGERAKLMDFGIALLREMGEFDRQMFHSVEGGVTGTPEYMSPEQAGGDPITEAADLYSMGCVLYMMLAGRLPFESETSSGFVSCHLVEDPLPLAKAHADTRGLPKELLELVDALLKKAPKDRPTGPKVIATLDAVLPKLKDKTGRQGGLWSMIWGGK